MSGYIRPTPVRESCLLTDLLGIGLDFGKLASAYVILELVGEGSFGRVFRGRRRFTGQFVALKFVAKAGKSADELSALRSEVSILRRLDHENIVLLLDFFETARDVVLVTEFAHGELLAVLAADGALPCSTVRSVASQLVAALRYLAASRVMHRDLKPQNCLIGSRGNIKLADFGFARELGAQRSALISSVKGTPLYMAPEMLAPCAAYTENADVWGLGVLIFELAAGRPPFYASSLAELVDVIVAPTPPPIPPEWDVHLSDFVRACLQRSPDKRPTFDALAYHPFLRDAV